MEWFFVFVGFMVILALIRIGNTSNKSKDQRIGSNEHMNYWIPNDVDNSNGGDGIDVSSVEDGGSFDGGSSDGGGGDSSGF